MKGTGHVNPLNVDTAVYNGPMANYDVALFGADLEGFLTISQTAATVVVGANPQGLLGAADDTDRIRNIERIQFTDGTVAIDKYGDELSSSFSKALDPNYDILYAPFYDAVPFGTPVITEKDRGRERCRSHDYHNGRQYADRQHRHHLRLRQHLRQAQHDRRSDQRRLPVAVH